MALTQGRKRESGHNGRPPILPITTIHRLGQCHSSLTPIFSYGTRCSYGVTHGLPQLETIRTLCLIPIIHPASSRVVVCRRGLFHSDVYQFLELVEFEFYLDSKPGFSNLLSILLG